ncbi:MAG: phospholipase A [Sulfurimonas sp.]|nr:phospholipase A [Sulfurimonas sp.]
MKTIMILIALILSLFAKNSEYKDAVYVGVHGEVSKNKEALFQTLNEIEDKETRNTIYQYSQSIFNIKAHHTNYLLPLSVRTNGDYNDQTKVRDTYRTEVEFQFSIKYDFAPNLLGLGELYTLAYTQHSFWQYYVGDAYFRANDYNPEVYVTVPMHTKYFKALRLSLAHKSNGLGVPQERAWNYVSLYTYFQYKSIFTELAVWKRVGDNYDYNPKLIDTMGHGHVKFIFPYKKHMVTTLFRNNFKGKGAVDASYSYPLFGESLFLYVKAFVGYGESMDTYAGNEDYRGRTQMYDAYVEKIGIGFSLSR